MGKKIRKNKNKKINYKLSLKRKKRKERKKSRISKTTVQSFGEEGDDRQGGLALFLAEKQWCVLCVFKHLIHEFSAVWSFTQTGDLAFLWFIGIEQVVVPAKTKI